MDHSDSVAQRYMKLCEAYLSLNEAFDKLDRYHSRLQESFRKLLDTAQKALVQLPILRQDVEQLQWCVEQRDRLVRSLREELQEKEARLGELIAKYDQVCHELEFTKAELLSTQALIEKLEAENAQLLQQLNRLTSLEEELARLTERLNQAEAARQALEARNHELEAALEERNRQIYSLQERLAHLEQESALLKTQRDEAQQTVQLALSRAEQAEAKLKAQIEETQTLHNELQQAKAHLSQMAGLLTEDSTNLLQETEKAVEADREVLPLVLASLPETERLVQEAEQLLSSCSDCSELAQVKPQAA